MAQPSVAAYFNTRKRSVHDNQVKSVKKVLKLDQVGHAPKIEGKALKAGEKRAQTAASAPKAAPPAEPEPAAAPSRSKRLTELRARIDGFKAKDAKLKAKVDGIIGKPAPPPSPKLQSFKALELEVQLSPQKPQTPEKPYLSPHKQPSTARRNLFNLHSPPPSPSKQALATATKPGLKLPQKYRHLAEIFRATDTIIQIMYNRHETITFTKLKPSVEEILKHNFTENHLGQLIALYPNAYHLTVEKLRQFGCAKRDEWQLVVAPVLGAAQAMTGEVVLARRRAFAGILLNRVRKYHQEFLLALRPPIVVEGAALTRWHAEFDAERVPDVEAAAVPSAPAAGGAAGARDVLERARALLGCNTRMGAALERYRARQVAAVVEPEAVGDEERLRGIPRALLERVRERQAAKALAGMTRTTEKDEQVAVYARLPEMARLLRNLYVTEKKGVLGLETVVEKLMHSCRSGMMRNCDVEGYLRLLAKEVPDWLVFHHLRGAVFLKLAKNADISKVIGRLEQLVKEKDAA